MPSRNALIAGSSGLVGTEILNIILNDPDYAEVNSLVRKVSGLRSDKLKEHVIDFGNLNEFKLDKHIDDVFCSLGTTIKKAGSQEEFYRVDFTYVVELARLAKSLGTQRFLVVSALGANPKSSIFYNRVKGEMEEAVKQIPFKSIYIFHPSVLSGNRKEVRRGEKAAIYLLNIFKPLMIGPLSKYRTTEARDVALAMVRAAKQGRPGIHAFESDYINQLVNEK